MAVYERPFGSGSNLTIRTTISLPENVRPLQHEEIRGSLELANGSGHRLYLVGGYLRDALGSHLPKDHVCKDFDFAVEGGTGFAFAKHVANSFEGHFVPLDEENDTARVVMPTGSVLDFSGCVGGTIASDVWRRDFSINALVWDPSHPDELTDFVGGLEDLKNKSIRALSESSFTDDPLRLLRAYRFAAHINGTIEASTLEWIKQHAERITLVAAERINLELFSILGKSSIAATVQQMADVGLLEYIFPELEPTRKVTANAFHHLGLFEHTIETIPQLESRLEELPEWVHESLRKELNAGVTRLSATKLACLLHDVGKPQTWQVNEDGRHTFYGHDRLGSEMCETIAERMKWSRPLTRFIVKLVKWHLRPGALSHQGPPTERAVRRFYRDIDEELPELILLAYADFGATRGPDLNDVEARQTAENNLQGLLNGYQSFKEKSQARVKLLDGNAVMALLGIPGGPIIGEILEELAEAQEFNEVTNRCEAEAFVREQYSKKYSK
jgi:putative nucleotidyltransferase with HDIG domain